MSVNIDSPAFPEVLILPTPEIPACFLQSLSRREVMTSTSKTYTLLLMVTMLI